MTDDALHDQIIKALELVPARCAECGVSDALAARIACSEYVNGGLQMATFLVRKDGEVTPQQLTRSLMLVGQTLGMKFGPPVPPGG